jgi:hypothetical protein
MTNEKNSRPGELIYELMPKIMADIPSIGKDRKNAQQNYVFRGIDDVYNALNGILAKHRVFMSAEILDEPRREERKSNQGGTLTFVQVRVRYRFNAPDGSYVTTDSLGEGMDSGDKATAKAMSVAQKYALFQAFLIPTADPKDVENDSPEPAYAAPKMVTEDQKIVIRKLRADKTDADVEKVIAYYHITNFPGDLTEEQAATVIKRWSK